MFQPLELFVGLRYIRAKRRNHFISFITLTSVMGIILGVMALITVMSVMNGFEKELRGRILGMASHMTISGLGGGLSNWQGLETTLRGRAHVVGSAPFIEKEAMLTNGGLVSGALVRGIMPQFEPRVSDVGDKVIDGDFSLLKPGSFGIILGDELAHALGGVRPGDKITVITPQAGVTPAGILPRLRRFHVVGIFDVDMREYDRSMAYIHMSDAARLFRMGDKVSGLRLKLDNMFEAPYLSHELNTELGSRYWVSDWTRQHANFFKAVKMEKTVMFIILLLIVAVAAFNIVSTLVMVVTDKRADIAILRTLGLTPGKVMLVFIIQGTVIGLAGTVLGLVGGVLLALNLESLVAAIETFFHTKFMSPDIYYISTVPSDLQIGDVVRIALIAFLLTVLATIYPAWRASRTDPAEALRYE